MCLPYCQVSPGCRSPGKPLGCSKRRLYLVPFTYSPPFLLGVPVVVLLGRPAQWTVVALDIVVLEILPVCFPKIVFVNLHLSWEHAETFSVKFYLHGKVGRFVIGAENGGYPPTQNGDIRSLFWLFSLMALQN